MEELMLIIEPLMEYLSPLLIWMTGIVAAGMEMFKRWDKEEKKFKKWYWPIGAGASLVGSLVITLLMGFTLPLFLIHFVFMFIVEVGIDVGVFEPVIKRFIPFLKKVLTKK